MIVDTSALVAILTVESDASFLLETIRSAPSASMSATGYLETGIVIDARRDSVLSLSLDTLLDKLDVRIRDVTASQARLARQAYRNFGKGSGHRAQLNFGDCFAYALAADTDEPLLYKGDDFAHAGVRSAVPH